MADVSGIEASAASVLSRAVEHDQNKRYASALTCYQEGIQLLMNAMKGITDSTRRQHYRQKIEEYMNRAEKVKHIVQKEKDAGTYHEQIQVKNGSTGNSYEQLFRGFLDDTVTRVEIADAYIRNTHQTYNLLRFCEMLVKYCPHLKEISLTTGHDENPQEKEGQIKRLGQLASSLRNYQVTLKVAYSSTLHDREIRFDSGWVIKIGRGLDYFKPTEHKFAISFCDYSLRQCHETTIDIFHQKFVRQVSFESS